MIQFFPNVLRKPKFDPEYVLVLQRADELGFNKPSESQQLLQNKLVRDLKGAGIWDRLEVFYLFATDADRNFAQLNWKNPSIRKITESGGVVEFFENSGFKGGNGYLDLNWDRRIDSPNYELNDASMYAYYNEVGVQGTLLGSGDQRDELNITSTPTVINRIHQGLTNANEDFQYSSEIIGLKGIHRLNDNDVCYTDKKSKTFVTAPSNAIRSRTLLFIRNTNFSPSSVRAGSFSGGLNLVDQNDDYNDIMDTYMTSI